MISYFLSFSLKIITGVLPSKMEITLITFANKQQAKNYAELNISYFAENPDNLWKVARSGRVVVITNLEVAEEVIPLEFE